MILTVSEVRKEPALEELKSASCQKKAPMTKSLPPGSGMPRRWLLQHDEPSRTCRIIDFASMM
jgi:hypothetical protein